MDSQAQTSVPEHRESETGARALLADSNSSTVACDARSLQDARSSRSSWQVGLRREGKQAQLEPEWKQQPVLQPVVVAWWELPLLLNNL